MIGICSLCLIEKELKESHIYPRHIYKKTGLIQKKSKNTVFEVRPYDNNQPVKRIEDPNWDGIKTPLLCHQCEQKLGNEYESYFCEVFLNREPPPKRYNIQANVTRSTQSDFLNLSNLNYTYIKLYVLSILWKSALVKQIYLSDRQIEKLRRMVYNGDARMDDDYSILFAAPKEIKDGDNQLISPFINFDFKGCKTFYTVIGNYAITVSQYGPTTIDYELYQSWENYKLKSTGVMSIELADSQQWHMLIFKFNGLGDTFDKYQSEFIKNKPPAAKDFQNLLP